MSNVPKNPGVFLDALDNMLSGLSSNLPAGTTQFTVDGKVSTVLELQSEIQGYRDVYKAADDAGTQYKNALIERDTIAPTANARFDSIRAALKVAFGKKSPNLANFGITPDKHREPLTTEQKTERVAKARATRVARHTMGPKQKKAIHGQVPPPAEPASAMNK